MKNFLFALISVVLMCVACSSDNDDEDNRVKIIPITTEWLEQGNGVWKYRDALDPKYEEMQFKNGTMTYVTKKDFFPRSGKYKLIGNDTIDFYRESIDQHDTLILKATQKNEEDRIWANTKKYKEPNNFMEGEYKRCPDPVFLK